jgi:hypothetical protein
MISNGLESNLVDSEQLNKVISFVILSIIFSNGCYFFFQTWFRYSEFQRRISRHNEANLDRLLSFKTSSAWVDHWTFKWFSRVISLLFLVIGTIGLIAFFQNVL